MGHRKNQATPCIAQLSSVSGMVMGSRRIRKGSQMSHRRARSGKNTCEQTRQKRRSFAEGPGPRPHAATNLCLAYAVLHCDYWSLPGGTGKL